MKVRLCFDIQSENITIFYRTFIMSLIKQALRTSNPSYFEKLYYWDGKKNKWIKPFCFAVGFPGFRLENNMIYCNKQFFLNISSSDYEFIINLHNGLINVNIYPFSIADNNAIYFKSSYFIRERNITTDQITFKTLSPILIERSIGSKKEPVTPWDDNFAECLNTVVDMELASIRQIQTGNRQGLQKKLEFEPIALKKEVIKHKISNFEKQTGKEYMTLTGFSGSFRLKGHPDDLNVIYQNGLGFRRSQGFGYVEVV